MACTYAAARADEVAAVAAVAGLRSPEVRPARPVPIVAFHGLADRINPYLGGRGDRWRESVPEAAAAWAAANGVETSQTSTEPGPGLTKITYGEGTPGEVTLWTSSTRATPGRAGRSGRCSGSCSAGRAPRSTRPTRSGSSSAHAHPRLYRRPRELARSIPGGASAAGYSPPSGAAASTASSEKPFASSERTSRGEMPAAATIARARSCSGSSAATAASIRSPSRPRASRS